MITPDDNARKNYERVKRWREKNRALVNLKQRNYRREKKTGGGGMETQPSKASSSCAADGETESGIPRRDSDQQNRGHDQVQVRVLPSRPSTIEALREMVKAEQEKPVVEAPVRLKVYRSETGAVITKEQWEAREEEKRLAREKGFEIDEYAQA